MILNFILRKKTVMGWRGKARLKENDKIRGA